MDDFSKIKLKAKKILSEDPEKDVEKLFILRAFKSGYDTYKLTSGENGLADRILLPGKGVTVFVELKRKSGKLSKKQKQIHGRFLARGYKVFCLYTKAQVREFYADEPWEKKQR